MQILNEWLDEQVSEIITSHSLDSLLDKFAAELTGTDVRDIDQTFDSSYVAMRNRLQEKLLAKAFEKLVNNEFDETPLLTRILDQITINWVERKGNEDVSRPSTHHTT